MALWEKYHDEHYGLWHVRTVGKQNGDRDIASFCTIEHARAIEALPQIEELLRDALFEIEYLEKQSKPKAKSSVLGRIKETIWQLNSWVGA